MTNKSIALFVFLCAPFLRLDCVAATVNGNIQGTVVDDGNKSVGGALVIVSHAVADNSKKSAGPPFITGAMAKSVVADSNGNFEINGLRAGDYVACAQTTVPGLLDPCHWGKSAPEFTVVAGQTVQKFKISMDHGAVIPIHINDPQGLLTPATGALDPACQFHIVTAKGLHYNATIQASTSAGRDYSITVPHGAPVTLQIVSPHLNLNDSSGNAVTPFGTAVNASANGANSTLFYTVAGKK